MTHKSLQLGEGIQKIWQKKSEKLKKKTRQSDNPKKPGTLLNNYTQLTSMKTLNVKSIKDFEKLG